MLTLLATGAGVRAYAAEHITLRSGFEYDCTRHEVAGEKVRLYLMPGARAGVAVGQGSAEDANYIEVAADAVLRIERIADPVAEVVAPSAGTTAADAIATAGAAPALLTAAEMRGMLERAGVRHNIDADLLASVVQAVSGGNARAVSRVGAAGLMQLMPGTAAGLGVRDRFAPEENIGGGTAYLDALLTHYHDDIALAVAAYNAGPAAVDHYHGIPPYAETRAYVARVIREFNRRKRAAARVNLTAHASLTANAK